jgi:hypothetical protein
MSLSTREIQKFFERVASDWDTMRLAYYDERVIERMAAVSGLDEGMTVADVGTGTGFVAAGIAPKAGRVIAVDNSSAMLEVARKNLGELGLANVELVEGDVGALPIESDSWTPSSPTWSSTMRKTHGHAPGDGPHRKPGGVVAWWTRWSIPTFGCAKSKPTSGSVHAGAGRGVLQRSGLPDYGYESLGMQ